MKLTKTFILIFIWSGISLAENLKTIEISSYHCISQYADLKFNGQIDFLASSKIQYYFTPTHSPRPILDNIQNLIYCHDKDKHGAQDKDHFPRLNQKLAHFQLWENTPPFENSVNKYINQELLKRFGIYSDKQLFIPLHWPSEPNQVELEEKSFQLAELIEQSKIKILKNSQLDQLNEENTEISNDKSIANFRPYQEKTLFNQHSPTIGLYMLPWKDKKTGHAFCPTQKMLNENHPIYSILKDLIDDTEAIYLAQSVLLDRVDESSKNYKMPRNHILINEGLLDKIGFFFENGRPTLINSKNENKKTIYIYWPARKYRPLQKSNEQELYRIIHPSEIDSSLISYRSKTDNRFGCIPVKPSL